MLSDGKSKMYKLFMTGGIDKSDPTNSKNLSENGTMVWFQTTFSNYLLKPLVQVFVIAVFLGYIAVSIYGVTTLEKGLHMKYLYPPDTPMYIFFDKEEAYFQNYPYRVQVLVKIEIIA